MADLYAPAQGVPSSRQPRAALNSSPWWGAGRVEDTDNLLGHAASKALGVVARQQGRGLAAVAEESGVPLLAGSSLKAALNCNWDDAAERAGAVQSVLDVVAQVQQWLADQQQTAAPAELAVYCKVWPLRNGPRFT